MTTSLMEMHLLRMQPKTEESSEESKCSELDISILEGMEVYFFRKEQLKYIRIDKTYIPINPVSEEVIKSSHL